MMEHLINISVVMLAVLVVLHVPQQSLHICGTLPHFYSTLQSDRGGGAAPGRGGAARPAHDRLLPHPQALRAGGLLHPRDSARVRPAPRQRRERVPGRVRRAGPPGDRGGAVLREAAGGGGHQCPGAGRGRGGARLHLAPRVPRLRRQPLAAGGTGGAEGAEELSSVRGIRRATGPVLHEES